MKKAKDIVGLYITPTRIEAALFSGPPSEPVLVDQYVGETPPDVLADDGSVADPAALSAALKAFWLEAGFRNRNVVLVLNSRKAIVRRVRLPQMPINSLHQAILSEAEQFALFRQDEPLIDYFVSEPEQDFVWACYGAVTEEVVDTYDKTLKGAGLNLVAVDLVQLAGQRGIEFFHPLTTDYWTGVMALPQRLIVSFWKDTQLRVMREILLPERDTIAMDLLAQNYLPEIVRSISTDTGFYDDPHLVVGCDRLENAQQLADHATPLFSSLVKVAGDPSWKNPDDDEELQEVSYITLGAALWGRPFIVPSLNLVSGRRRRGPSMPTLPAASDLVSGLAVPMAAVLVAGVGINGWQLWHKSQREAQATSLKRQVQDIQFQTQDNQLRLTVPPPEAEMLKQWMPFHEENAFAARFLSTLREIIPSDAWLTKVTYSSGKQIHLAGNAINQTSCLYFADQIGGLSHVEQVRIVKLEKSGSVYAFEILAGLGAPAQEALQ